MNTTLTEEASARLAQTAANHPAEADQIAKDAHEGSVTEGADQVRRTTFSWLLLSKHGQLSFDHFKLGDGAIAVLDDMGVAPAEPRGELLTLVVQYSREDVRRVAQRWLGAKSPRGARDAAALMVGLTGLSEFRPILRQLVSDDSTDTPWEAGVRRAQFIALMLLDEPLTLAPLAQEWLKYSTEDESVDLALTYAEAYPDAITDDAIVAALTRIASAKLTLSHPAAVQRVLASGWQAHALHRIEDLGSFRVSPILAQIVLNARDPVLLRGLLDLHRRDDALTRIGQEVLKLKAPSWTVPVLMEAALDRNSTILGFAAAMAAESDQALEFASRAKDQAYAGAGIVVALAIRDIDSSLAFAKDSREYVKKLTKLIRIISAAPKDLTTGSMAAHLLLKSSLLEREALWPAECLLRSRKIPLPPLLESFSVLQSEPHPGRRRAFLQRHPDCLPTLAQLHQLRLAEPANELGLDDANLALLVDIALSGQAPWGNWLQNEISSIASNREGLLVTSLCLCETLGPNAPLSHDFLELICVSAESDQAARAPRVRNHHFVAALARESAYLRKAACVALAAVPSENEELILSVLPALDSDLPDVLAAFPIDYVARNSFLSDLLAIRHGRASSIGELRNPHALLGSGISAVRKLVADWLTQVDPASAQSWIWQLFGDEDRSTPQAALAAAFPLIERNPPNAELVAELISCLSSPHSHSPLYSALKRSGWSELITRTLAVSTGELGGRFCPGSISTLGRNLPAGYFLFEQSQIDSVQELFGKHLKRLDTISYIGDDGGKKLLAKFLLEHWDPALAKAYHSRRFLVQRVDAASAVEVVGRPVTKSEFQKLGGAARVLFHEAETGNLLCEVAADATAELASALFEQHATVLVRIEWLDPAENELPSEALTPAHVS